MSRLELVERWRNRLYWVKTHLLSVIILRRRCHGHGLDLGLGDVWDLLEYCRGIDMIFSSRSITSSEMVVMVYKVQEHLSLDASETSCQLALALDLLIVLAVG